MFGAAPVASAEGSELALQRTGEPRPLTTDRPDTTESPYTVDSGRIQIETTIVGFSRTQRDQAGIATESFEFGTTNFRVGVTHEFELNVVVRPYGAASSEGNGDRGGGIGAIDVRAKLSLAGNDGGPIAIAVLPFVSIPLEADNGISPVDNEYGFLIPIALDLGERFGLGLNGGVHVRRENGTSGYRVYGLATASFAASWSDRLGSYFEIAGEVGNERPVSISLNTGVTWRIGDNLQFDAGTQFGISGDASPLAPFVGFSLRL